ncbi:hypothetical protein [Inquilinus sp. Marseille-Q2685]|uniref:hypothetical protein n=1 Tax=Inquilinus sp. Marseille-Q2685 TaxID=2866581 RepID=UPI001CE3D041|nr:hypothetical protein [Inquilinus sp. Marseille-Q2685]
MKFRPILIALAVMATATAAQAQVPLDPLQAPPSRAPSSPTPSQPLVKPGLPSRPERPVMAPAPTAPAASAAVPAAVPGGQDAGRTVPLEQQQAHPSGVSMMLTGITFRADSVIVSASITNLSGRPVSLNRAGSLVLVDDRGRVHPFVPPAGNPEVEIAPRSRVNASFVFAGPITGDARSVQLSTNGPSGSRSDRLTSAPSFMFRVPVS